MGYPLGYNYEYDLGTTGVAVPRPSSFGVRAAMPCPTTGRGYTLSNRRAAEGYGDQLMKHCIPNALEALMSDNRDVQDHAITALRFYVDELARAVRYLR